MAVGTEDDLERCGPVIADALRPSRRVSEVQRRKLGLDSVSDALAERGIVDDGEINHDLVVDQGGHGFPPETKVLDEHPASVRADPVSLALDTRANNSK
jgi:hypothetical protein